MNQTNENTATTPAQEEKTFTQEQVNAIVGERLAKEKTKADAALAEKERELAQRELLLTAKEKIAEKGLPPELLDAINVTSAEALDNSLAVVEAIISQIKTQPPVISGMKPGGASEGVRTAKNPVQLLREGMGLTK